MSEKVQAGSPDDAAPDAGGAVPSRAELLAARVNERWSTLLSHADKGAARLREAARELRRAPALQHALAARDRGNLEASFWLLAEAFEQRPDDAEVAAVYWDVAVALERVELASPAALCLVQHHASAGEVELAAQHWVELVQAAPDVCVGPTVIATILPVLREKLSSANIEERRKARALIWRAMRSALDPRNGTLTPGLALRLFEEGRDVNPEAARQAAEVALGSPDLHEAKRARLQAWMEGQDPDEALPDAPAPRTNPVPPLEPSVSQRAAPQQRPKALSEQEIAAASARLPPVRRRAKKEKAVE